MPRKYGSIDFFGGVRQRTYVGNAGVKGLGCFAAEPIAAGEIIEAAPVLLIPTVESTALDSFVFEYDDEQVALALGFVSLLNHSLRPNADYELTNIADISHPTITTPGILIRALRPIKQGQEITINYNGDPKDQSPWNFDVA